MKSAQLDPLYIIFEQRLFGYQDPEADRRIFVKDVVSEYLTYLRRKKIAIPKSLEPAIVEELENQVRTMLLKKIYGFHNLGEYQKRVPKTIRRRAGARYAKLK